MIKNFEMRNLKNDIPVGIIIALISIPISMGYAEVAGLPPEYGLYGSVIPIFIFGFITTSPRFVFGVDAAPAALLGAMLVSVAGIKPGTPEAVKFVPAFTLLVSGWLFIFRVFNAGRMVKYISKPVMEGFITGISFEIILMQIPKLFGGSAGIGELFDLIPHIVEEFRLNLNLTSLILGIGTVAVITAAKKFTPKLPMAVILMFVGVFLTKVFHIDRLGVKLLPSVTPGVPNVSLPDMTVFKGMNIREVILASLTIALVITAESLLATGNCGLRYGDKIDNNRELLGYAVGNFASSICGCCPVNGSVSRTGIADQFGVKSQIMSISAALTMLLILMFGTGFIEFLPVPVLTGIVISSLISTLEFGLAHKLKKVDRTECFIFYAVFAAVLLLGTIYGVLTGVILSFVTVIIRAAKPQVDFMGVIEGEDSFYSVGRIRSAKPIKDVAIYQLKGPLFFANIGKFQEDLMTAADDGAKVIIIDARGIGSIDITAAERLDAMYDTFKNRGIAYYITEHDGHINDQFRAYGVSRLILEGVVRRHIEDALMAEGITRPYETEENAETVYQGLAETVRVTMPDRFLDDARTAELEWSFGNDADDKIKELAEELAQQIVDDENFDERTVTAMKEKRMGKTWNVIDDNKFLDLLEMQLAIIAQKREERNEVPIPEIVEERLADYHMKLEKDLTEHAIGEIEKIDEARAKNEKSLKSKYPAAYEFLCIEKEKYRDKLAKEYPGLLERIAKAKVQIDEKDIVEGALIAKAINDKIRKK